MVLSSFQTMTGNPVLAKVSKVCADHQQMVTQLQLAEAHQIDMKKKLETAEQNAHDQSEELLRVKLELADAQTLISQSQVGQMKASGTTLMR